MGANLKKHIAIFSSLLFLSSCGSPINVDLNYAHTSLGYRNSGQLADGQIYIWDKEANTLSDLRSPATLKVASRRVPTTLVASQVKGFELTGKTELPEIVKAEATAKVQNGTKFLAESASRVTNSAVYSSVSAAYAALRSEGVDAYSAWKIDLLRSNRKRYKLVVLVDPVYADKEESSINKDVEGAFSVSSQGGHNGQYQIKIPNNVSASCSGKAALCYINTAVLNVRVKEDGNLDYVPSEMKPSDIRNLSAAFRGL